MRTVKEIKADMRLALTRVERYDATFRVSPDQQRRDDAGELLDKWQPILEALKNELKSHPEVVAKRNAKNAARRERHGLLTDMGLKRVKGAVTGRTYYE